ncbi:hypothetical protein KKF81_03180 [Candidatus Micrarchaeota archaeon]|nr:hypothetical protein [Candidatus Micrarchaeota archaeon]MBU1165925.1 hypothetical protein [Candidatus Micrarchaeota archaeon]MBU1887153.1 hypothetical protein [Candidatus Micrarchaeota archaeon]
MLLELALAFLAGIVVKAVDWLEDDKKSSHPVKYFLAIVYGILIGYVIGNAAFSVIFIAALIAQILARKVDTITHEIGFLFAILTTVFFITPQIELPIFVYFIAMAFGDEVKFTGPLKTIVEYRPFLKLAALSMLVIGRWDYFIGIMVFDIGYFGFQKIAERLKL